MVPFVVVALSLVAGILTFKARSRPTWPKVPQPMSDLDFWIKRASKDGDSL